MLCLHFVGACFTQTASCMTKMVWVKAMEILSLERWSLEEVFLYSKHIYLLYMASCE